MLSPEQMRERRNTNELAELRRENERLREQLQEIRAICGGLIREMAAHRTLRFSSSDREKLLELAKDIEA